MIQVDEALISSIYPRRRRGSHKGQNGRVLVVGGSWLYHGAPVIASLAAMAVGVDLIYLAVPEPLVVPARCASPNLIVIPLPDYRFTKGSADRLLKLMPEVDAVLVGNGMGKGQHEGLVRFLREVNVKGIVLDADGLRPEAVKAASGRSVVLTPHEGEFRRISGADLAGKGLEERASIVQGYARDSGVTVVLKGQVDIISDGSEAYANGTGNAGMTVGGTGDALAGASAAFLSKLGNPLHAGVLAAYFNGLAGDEALKEKGLHFTATDVVEMYPRVMKRFDVLVD